MRLVCRVRQTREDGERWKAELAVDWLCPLPALPVFIVPGRSPGLEA